MFTHITQSDFMKSNKHNNNRSEEVVGMKEIEGENIDGDKEKD